MRRIPGSIFGQLWLYFWRLVALSERNIQQSINRTMERMLEDQTDRIEREKDSAA